MLLVAVLLAIAVCAGALACFNATLKRGEKNKTRESVAEWTQQNARLLQYKMDRYYDTLENVARSVQNLPMNSQKPRKRLDGISQRKIHILFVSVHWIWRGKILNLPAAGKTSSILRTAWQETVESEKMVLLIKAVWFYQFRFMTTVIRSRV